VIGQLAVTTAGVQFKLMTLTEAADATSPVGAEGTTVHEDGGDVGLVTVNTAMALVTDPAAFVTTTS